MTAEAPSPVSAEAERLLREISELRHTRKARFEYDLARINADFDWQVKRVRSDSSRISGFKAVVLAWAGLVLLILRW